MTAFFFGRSSLRGARVPLHLTCMYYNIIQCINCAGAIYFPHYSRSKNLRSEIFLFSSSRRSLLCLFITSSFHSPLAPRRRTSNALFPVCCKNVASPRVRARMCIYVYTSVGKRCWLELKRHDLIAGMTCCTSGY